jgi:hypothetical protein
LISKPGPDGLDSSEAEIDLKEISRKLDTLAASVERLTEIAIENRRLINNLNLAMSTGSQPNADPGSQGFTRNRKKESRPGTESYRDPFSYASGTIPASSSAESEDESSEDLQEERVKKYEDENPW